MPNKPLLTVAIVVQNHRDVIESTLTSLYDISGIPLELFIVDDGSSDNSDEVTQSVLDYYQHEQTFYFARKKPAGLGNSLNEVLSQRNGRLFWAPQTIADIDVEQLSLRLEQLTESTKSVVALQGQTLPTNYKEWLSLISQKNWPQNGSFIWDLSALSPGNHFFNPYLTAFHGLELAARLGDIPSVKTTKNWFSPSSFFETTEPDFTLRQELLLTLLRRADYGGSMREAVLEAMQNLPAKTKKSYDNDLLNEAVQMKQDGRFNAALELIEEVLQNNPSHSAASNLKIEILEKKRRFVEASELKHQISKSQQQKKSSSPQPETIDTEEEDEDIKISVIVPTTTYGKPALEHCLLSLSKHCATANLELIVVDNASLDNTHDYLDELREKNFLNCKVITNKKNAGFAASVNQALEKTNGKYACIIHNDIEFVDDAIGKLSSLMDENPEFAVVGPTTNKTLNPDQAAKNIEESAPDLIRAEYLDSFCMMVRTDAGLKMDETFQLAFFEDIDLCFQARAKDFKVGIAPHIEIKHHFGTTTFALDLDTESEQYWKNVSYFNEKWDIEVFSEDELKSLSTFDQLLALDDIVNPLFPEQKIQDQFNRLFTDEIKTEILNSQHDDDVLCKLVHLFMVMGEREIMRRLEDRLDNIDIPAPLIYQLVHFYFERNIYSRCTHYLNRLKQQNESLRADLYRLAILVENKDLDQAIPRLKTLMEHAPANPMLYKLAGDIHKFSGNKEEAQSFYDLAEQINPFEFANEEKDAFGFTL
ncbi:glycosyltransferase family 2 protein [Fodinibius sp. Rm-B-1B1-1]|uniref:glycosyltransferase family 2 protein n=1 Tax=Fodinibius alkaliphilus TaxID=3140241 RepID=UPI003159E1D5